MKLLVFGLVVSIFVEYLIIEFLTNNDEIVMDPHKNILYRFGAIPVVICY